ncbi:hypothetical protein [Gorillibacterium sp. CAU 1737]|uniref:hypothetical protein n=1 Tax=Gorillibacterium sp. CAU 1737 TaxID=3140362 RepID=UPI0032612FD9
MKSKGFLALTAVAIVIIAILVNPFATKKVKVEQVTLEQVEDIGLRNLIGMLTEPNVYFFETDSSVILYSTMGKSGLYTYPTADIKLKGKRLVVDITSNQKTALTKEGLLVKMDLKSLPEDISVRFLGGNVPNYQVFKP